MMKVMIDANVIVSVWAFDVIMCLADARLLEVNWSEEILSEFVKTSERLHGKGLAEGVRQALEEDYSEAIVYNWERHIDEIVLPDPDDRHVVAAALKGGCDAIVTFNLKDFPQEELQSFGIRAVSPDDLMMELVHKAPVRVLMVVQGLIDSKRRPPRTYDQEIEGLRRCGLKRFAEWLDS